MRSKMMTRRAFLAHMGATGAALALAACTPKTPAPTTAPEVAATTASQQPTAQPTSGPPLELIYCYGAVAELPDLPLVQEEMNKILKERLNITLEHQVFPYAAYSDKMAAKNAAGEKWDLSYSSMVRQPYFQSVANGAFADITDALPKYAPKFWADINPAAWGAIKVKGKFYGSLLQGLWVVGAGAICRNDLVVKYGLDLNKINKIEDMEPWQEAIVKGEAGKVVAPYTPGYWLWRFYQAFGVDQPVYGYVNTDDTKNLKVNHIYDTPQWHDVMKLTKKWFQAGFFPQEQIPEAEITAWQKAGKDAWLLHRASPLGHLPYKENSTGFEMVSKILENPTYLSSGAMTNTTAVSRNTSSVEACCKYLDLINTDKPLLNLIGKGIEGKHWVWKDKAKEIVEFPAGLDAKNHPYNPNTLWMHGSAFNSYYIDEIGPQYTAAARKLNSTSKPSAILGFVLDQTPVKNELAALTAVATEFQDLNYGLLDYDKVLPDLISKYKAAGADTVLAELQKQLLEWQASNS